MADSASDREMESDTSSIDGGPVFRAGDRHPIPRSVEALQQERLTLNRRIESLQQENRVLRVEVDTLKLKCKNLTEENRSLRKASVAIQARAEQEEEYISNNLLKKIQELKKEKESLAMNYEQEEEFLTNDLSRKLMQLQREKAELEKSLEEEQKQQVNKLMKKIDRLESETHTKQTLLEQLKQDKVNLENSLEQEQELLVNKLWKRMDKLETEKRTLQSKLDQPVSAPPSPRDSRAPANRDSATLTVYVSSLRKEVQRLRNTLTDTRTESAAKTAAVNQMREENLRLNRKLQLEQERREALCRHLSESESSLEMEDERHFNEMSKNDLSFRQRTVSSPTTYSQQQQQQQQQQQSPSASRPISPGMSPQALGMAASVRCFTCGQVVNQLPFCPPSAIPTSSSLPKRHSNDRFMRPTPPIAQKPPKGPSAGPPPS